MAKNKLQEALQQIRDIAMEHPMFNPGLFANRDVAGLDDIGGDVADWTTVAILADDAIKGVK